MLHSAPKTLTLALAALCAALVVIGVLGRDAPPTAGQPARSGPPAEVLEGEIAVRLRPGATLADLARIEAITGGRIGRGYARSRVVRVTVPEDADVAAVLAALRRDGRVEEANTEFVSRLATAPDDPGYGVQWNLKDTATGVRAEGAWQIAPALGQGVKVAVLDTGVAYEACNCWNGWFQPAPDLDGKTYVSPWDFVSNDVHANDDNGHGTLVTGVLAQDTNNGWRYAGVAPGATIMPVKVINYGGTGTAADLVEGIYWAVDHGADVISMSVVFPGTGQPDASGNVCGEIVGLTDALDYAYANDIVIVAASGNDGAIANYVYCPAAYPAAISVGATTATGSVPMYSNRGSELDVTAPGGDSTTGVTQEGYCYSWVQMYSSRQYDDFCPVSESGTSLAVPHVAGIAALMLGEDPALAPAAIAQILRSSARDRGVTGWDEAYGWGIVDAQAAVMAVVEPPAAATATPGPTSTPNACSPDADGDGMSDCYENAHGCLNASAADAGSDPDADTLTNGEEYGAGTNPCVRDTDGDGCADGIELGPVAGLGGLRDPLSHWDFYDVTGDHKIDSRDIAIVRSTYNPRVGPEFAAYDRSSLVYAWAPGPPDGAIDAIDTALVRAAFGHAC